MIDSRLSPRYAVPVSQIDLIARILDQTDRASCVPCWLWTGYLVPGKNHLPRIAVGALQYFPSKVLYEAKYGPCEFTIRNRCRTAGCINPEHFAPTKRRLWAAKYDPVEFFWKNVVKQDGCWGWLGPTDKGYGLMRTSATGGARSYASRFSYILHNGPIHRGQLVCHRCDNPPCTNPEHLYVGSYKDNKQDSVRAGTHARGETDGNSKLTTLAVRDIRASYANGTADQAALATRYGVNQATISSVLKRKTWRHVV